MEKQNQEKINELEIKLVGFEHTLSNQSVMINDIKEILKKQSDILVTVSENRRDTDDLKDELDALKVIFEKRKEVTDNNNESFKEFVNRFKGGLAVFVFVFSVIQGVVAYTLKDNTEQHVKMQTEINRMVTDIAVIKRHEETIHGQKIQ